MIHDRMGLSGKTIGSYILERPLGRGGMGTVYLARHKELDKPVAFKVLSSDLVADESSIKRFIQEARSAAKLEHPNIVQVYDAGRMDDCCYYVMQYVEGKNLEEVLRARKKLTVKETVTVIRKAGQALSVAHKAGIVHRDIKPANILISRDGKIKLSDFGLSKMLTGGMSISQPGQIMGTPYFMSPEQAKGEKVDARSDIYSLGVTFYYLLTGQKPFDGETPVTIVMKHLSEPAKPLNEQCPGIPGSLSAIVEKMMAKNPVDRFQNMDEVLAAIERAAGDIARIMESATGVSPLVESATASGETMTVGPSGGRRLLWIAAGCGAVAAVILAIVLIAPSKKGAGQGKDSKTPAPVIVPDRIVDNNGSNPAKEPPKQPDPAPTVRDPDPDDKKHLLIDGLKKHERARRDISQRSQELFHAIRLKDVDATIAFIDPRIAEKRSEAVLRRQITFRFDEMTRRNAVLEKAEVVDIKVELLPPTIVAKTSVTVVKDGVTSGEIKEVKWVNHQKEWYITEFPF